MAMHKIGWIGTGNMGEPMAGHLLDAGLQLFVHNRTRSRAGRVLARGATWCDNVALVARQAQVVFTILGHPHDVEEVYLGDNGLLASGGTGRILVDMTTSEPSLARRIAAAALARDIMVLDAPVSGGEIGARERTLAIMVGGDLKTFYEVLPLFERMGREIRHMGPPGAGQHTKLSNQLAVAGTLMGVCEALLYAERQGMDVASVVAIISHGAAASWAMDHLAPRILAGDFAPGFRVEHFAKDLGIALHESKAIGLRLPGLEVAHELYQALVAHNRGKEGTQALIDALREVNHLHLAPT